MILSNINNETFHIFEYYFQKFDSLYINPIIFVQFTVVVTIIYFIRLTMFLSIESSKNHEPNKLKIVRLYILRHIGFEYLMGYIICYCLINMTNAGTDNYVINILIAPAIGFVSSVILDIKCIMPLEKTNSDIGLPDMGFKPKKEESKPASPSNTSSGSNNNTITVNVNTNGNNGNNNEDIGCKSKDGTNNCSISRLSYDIINTDDYNKTLIDSINGMIDEQNRRCVDMTSLVDKLSKRIDEIENKLQEYIEDLAKIKKAEVDELKPVLKKDIYDCLNRGFVTPAENDRITAEYITYINLGGNHEVEFLYEKHYLKLGVHEDRRKSNIAVANDRRSDGIRYEYGCFDNMTLENEEGVK